MVDLDGKFVYSDVKAVRTVAASTTGTNKLFPNPAREVVNITIDPKMANTVVMLVNQAGQVVATKTANANSNLVTLEVSGLQAGLYVVKISNDNGSAQTLKLVVQH